MSFGPFTGWTDGRAVYLKEDGSMACLSSHRRISTSIPVPLTLVRLERIEGDLEVWLVETPDRGLYVTTQRHLEAVVPYPAGAAGGRA
jgi:hypothetical protein